MENFFELKNIYYTYDTPEEAGNDPNYVLKDISIGIEKGSFTCILGHNGSGKSTFAKILNLILSPSKGELYIDGKKIGDDPDDDEIFETRRKVGMVFQNPDNQIVTTIVEEDVAFGPENLGVEPAEIRRRVDKALATVDMTEYARHSTHQLSGGQKQRIAIAGVIAMQPSCIIFDESTAMLDPLGRKAVMETMQKLNKEHGITVVHITHNMDEAIVSDRVIVINDGSVYLDGTPEKVFSNVERLRAVGLDVPQVTELFHDLNESGMKLPNGIIDIEKGADILASAIANGKN